MLLLNTPKYSHPISTVTPYTCSTQLKLVTPTSELNNVVQQDRTKSSNTEGWVGNGVCTRRLCDHRRQAVGCNACSQTQLHTMRIIWSVWIDNNTLNASVCNLKASRVGQHSQALVYGEEALQYIGDMAFHRFQVLTHKHVRYARFRDIR